MSLSIRFYLNISSYQVYKEKRTGGLLTGTLTMWKKQVPVEFYQYPYELKEKDMIFNHPKSRRNHFLFDLLWLSTAYILCGVLFLFVRPSTQIFSINDPSIAFPLVPEVLPNTITILTSFVIPIIIIAFTGYFFFGGYTRDVLFALLGYLHALGITLLACGILWTIFGGFRPNFLALCRPNLRNPPLYTSLVQGTAYYLVSDCQGDIGYPDIHAFPSGHAATSWASWMFASFYVTTRLRTFYDHDVYFWKIFFGFLCFIPVPLYVTASRVLDYRHSASQTLVGALIGFLSAILAYRLVHVALPWRYYGHITTGMAKQNNVINQQV